MTALPIGKVAARSGLSIESIRYYERIGLLTHPPRSRGGQRMYEASHIERLLFIRRGRDLGFSLAAIRALLEVSDGGRDCMARELASRHLADVRSKIATLQRLERALENLTASCKPGNQKSCPIYDALLGLNECGTVSPPCSRER